MSWFAFDSPASPSSLDLDQNYCNYPNKRMCTATEVCPESPGHQSAAGVVGESPDKALLVAGDAFVDVATCQMKSLSQLSGWTVDGVLCCADDDTPPPKDFVEDGAYTVELLYDRAFHFLAEFLKARLG